MDRLLEMEVFAAVNDLGSFVQAAAKLRMSPPAVTRAVSSLENRLGTQLLVRTTRQLSLTDAGSRYLQSTRRLLAEIELAEQEAIGEAGVVQGHLSISASVTFGRMVVAPMVRRFLAANPRITASVTGLDRVVNLVEEGFDVAVRIGQLPDSNLLAKRAGEVRRVWVASPDYLRRRGVPSDPGELKLHAIIGFTGIMPGHEWHYKSHAGKGHVALRPRFEVNDAPAAIAAAAAGEGITMALSYMVADQLKSGQLAPLMTEYLPKSEPVHLIYPSSKLVMPKLRAFLDFSTGYLRTELDRLSLNIPNLAP